MKKIIIIFLSFLLLTGCKSNNQERTLRKIKNNILPSNSYYLESKMEIYSSEDTYLYEMKVYYLEKDYFKVSMINKTNDNEQIILRNKDAVYVITPSLNKSYKFESEWPYNSSQSYILNCLKKDIEQSKSIELKKEKEGYSLKASVNYPNNQNLSYEMLYFDKNYNLKEIVVYDNKDIIAIKVTIQKLDKNPNLDKNDFSVDKIIKEKISDSQEEQEKETSYLDEIIYPLYLPVNTYLKSKDKIDTDEGERVILTFNGDKNFVLIEQGANVKKEFEITPVYGEPYMLNNTIGAITNNSISWTNENVDYYLTSNDLSKEELMTIAESLSMTVALEK